MQSAVRKESYGSVTVFWLERDLIKRRLHKAAEELGRTRPEVQRVILFGSLAHDRAVPGSDADVLVIAQNEDRWIDRAMAYRPYFDGLGVGLDLFVHTEAEIARSPVAAVALRTGIELWPRPSSPPPP